MVFLSSHLLSVRSWHVGHQKWRQYTSLLGFLCFGNCSQWSGHWEDAVLAALRIDQRLIVHYRHGHILEVDSSQARYIGPQVLFGFGLGFGNQIPMTAVQGLSKPADIAVSFGIMITKFLTSIATCMNGLSLLTSRPVMQALSGTSFILIAQSIFANRMLHKLRVTYPNINTGQVVDTETDDIKRAFQGADLAAVLDAHMVGIKGVFAFSLTASALTVLIALAIPLRRLPDHGSKKMEEALETQNREKIDRGEGG